MRPRCDVQYYSLYALRVKSTAINIVASLLKMSKKEIERRYTRKTKEAIRISRIVKRRRSILLILTSDVRVNVLSDVLAQMFPNQNVQVPYWS